MKIVGIDLGVRSIHLSMPPYDVSLSAPRGERSDEINDLLSKISAFYTEDWYAFIEEPVVAGARNLRTSLQIAQIAGVVMTKVSKFTLVPVATWKKAVVGKGNASKDDVAEWLRVKRPELYERTAGIQDKIDANCIRLYGERFAARYT